VIPNGKQLKLSFLSNVACNKVANANFPKEDAQTQAPLSEEQSVSFSARARRDGFVYTGQVEKAVAAVRKPAEKGIKWLVAIALGVLGTGIVSTAAIAVPLLSKKAPPPPEIANTAAKVVKAAEETVVAEVGQLAPQIVATANPQSSHPQTQSSSLKTKVGNFFTDACSWVGDRMSFNQPNHQVPIATVGGAPAAKPVVVSPVASVASAVTYPYSVVVAKSPYSRFTNNITSATKCKKGTPNYPAYTVYRDSLKSGAKALKSAISSEVEHLMGNPEPALASRNLYELHGFLSELIFEVSKGNISNNYNLRTLKNSDLCTVPVMRQILSDTQTMLELPTLIKGAEDQRAHLKAKIKLYMATLDAYYNNGMVTNDWAALTKPTRWEMKNGSECLDAARFEDINSILLAGQQGKDINKHLASMLKKLMEDLGSVTGREQNIYSNKYKSYYDETTKTTIFTDYIMTEDGDIIAPWFSSH
jgi:hypothetical protein